MNLERLNIKDFTIEEPESQDYILEFGKRIEELDWNKIKETLESVRDKKWHDFFIGIRAIKLVYPNKSKEIELDEEVWEEMNVGMDFCRKNQGPYMQNLANDIITISVLDYEKLKELVTKDDVEIIKQDLEKHQERMSLQDLARFNAELIAMKVLGQEDVEKRWVNEDFWNEMKTILNRERQDENARTFCWLAADMKIIFPERDKELNIDNNQWRKMVELLDGANPLEPQFGFTRYLSIAEELKILSSEKVEITDNVLELVPHISGESESHLMPEVRSF